MKKWSIPFVGFFFLFLAGCVDGSPSSDFSSVESDNIPSAFETTEFYFSLPDNWEVFSQEALAGKNIDFAAREPKGMGTVETTVAVSSQEISSTLGLERLVSQSLENIRKKSQNYKKVSQETQMLGSNPAVFVEYTDRNSSDLSQLSFLNIFTISRGKGYIITFSLDAQTDSSEKEDIRKMMNSFRVK